MLLYVFTIILLFLIYVLYHIYDKDILSPNIMFCLIFFIAALSALYNAERWYLDLSLMSFIYLITGILSICCGYIITFKLYSKGKTIPEFSYPVIKMKIFSKIVYFLVQIITIYLTYDFIMTNTEGNTFAEHMFMYRLMSISGDMIDIPMYITVPFLFCQWTIYIFAYKFICDFFYKKKNYFLLVILFNNIILNALTSAKGPIIWYFLGLIALWGVVYMRKNKWKSIVSVKFIIRCIIGLLLFFAFFVIMAFVLGRQNAEMMTDDQLYMMIFDYLSIYMGAELKLFDNLVESFSMIEPNYMGYNSFNMIYHWLGGKLGIEEIIQSRQLDFGYVNQIGLGNVYTCFAMYFLDFGFLGIIMMPFFMGAFFGGLYATLKYSKKQINAYGLDIQLLFYANVVFTMTLSFFSDWFYNFVFSPWTIKGMISLIIGQRLFLNKISRS